MFMDDGYMTDYGIDVTKVTWKIVQKNEWNGILAAYLKLATGLDIIKNERAYIHESINKNTFDITDSSHISVVGRDMDTSYYQRSTYYVSLSNGISFNSFNLMPASGNITKIAPLLRISGDAYIVDDYAEDFKIIYNEKSLGLYLKEDRRLVQLSRSVLEGITSFINH
tara:strand:- start:105 stop:608 length:504 start_codon:yes stop_codon:yes gene_type:complete